jgi:hypothetical protein
MARETCAHCGQPRNRGNLTWNPLDEKWQCVDVVRCVRAVAEAKLATRLRREMGK